MKNRTDIDRLHDEIKELVDELWHLPRFAGGRRGFRPQADCIRCEDPPELRVIVELPGVDPATIKVVAADRVLVVAGERRRPQVERPLPPAGDRVRPLPAPHPARRAVDASAANARYEQGMLIVTLPIAAQAPQSRARRDRDPRPRMSSELNFEEPFEPGDVEIPSTLPVLPLKETVVFPQSVSPLAIGQERSVQLVDDVLEGERMLALVTVKNPEVDAARLGRPLRDRHRRGRAQDDPRPRRDAADPRPGRRPHPARAPRPGRPVPGRRVRRRARRGRGDARSSRR